MLGESYGNSEAAIAFCTEIAAAQQRCDLREEEPGMCLFTGMSKLFVWYIIM